MSRLTCGLLALLPATLFGIVLIPIHAGERGTSYAFLVGCAKYRPTEFKELPTPVNDVTAFRDALLATGFDPDNIVTLHDDAKERRYQPEKAKILAELDLLLEGMRPEDTLIVALSGHGLQYKGENISYFVPVDAKLTDKSTLLPLDGPKGLYEKLRTCKAKKKLLLINACRNDPSSSLDFASHKVELVDEDREGEVPEGIAAIYSCKAGQKSYYDPKRKLSLFYEHTIRAWKGEYSTDGKVTLEQFFQQVTTKTKMDANRTLEVLQVPVVKRDYRGEWVISAVRAPKKTTASNVPSTPPPTGAALHIDGQLTEQDAPDKEATDCYCKVFPRHLLQGKSYKIELRSKDFDAYLRLEDSDGKQVADDNNGAGGTDARIVFTPKVTGDYRIVVTTFRGKEKGRFTLDVAEVGAGYASNPPTLPTVPAAPPPGGVLRAEAGKPAQVGGQLTTADLRDKQGKYYKAFPAQLQAGVNYRIVLKGVPPLDAYVRLEDQGGNVLKEDEFGDPNESGIRFQPAASGTYRIVATTFKDGMTGSFTLTLSLDSATAAAPTSPPAVPAVPATTPGVLTLVPGGAPVYVEGTVTAADPRDGQGRNYKAYTFQAQVGKVYHFEMAGQNGFDPAVRVESSSGSTLKEEDIGDGKISRLAFTPTQGGSYRVITSAFKAGSTGNFGLTAKVVDLKQAASNTLDLASGKATIDGFIGSQDGTDQDGKHYKIYTFFAQASKTYRVEMIGKSGLDPYVRIEDQGGKVVKQEDFGDGKVSRLFFQPYQAGNYRAVVTTFKPGLSGSFTLVVEESAVQGAKTAALYLDQGKAVVQSELAATDGTIAGGKFVKEYTFQAQAGKTYKIDLHSTDFDAYLYLKDANGLTLAENDDNGESLDSRIVYKAEKSGTYRIVATCLFGGKTGRFTLTIATQSDGPQRLVIPGGAPVKTPGRLTAADPRDTQGHHYHAFVFQAEAGRSYRFEMQGVQGLDPLVRVEDLSGKVLQEEDFGDGDVSRLVFTAPQSAEYRVIVAGFKAGATGNYVLSASQVTK